MMNGAPVFVGFWVSFLVAALFSYPIYAGLKKLKIGQNVSQFAPTEHQVKQGTPTMGGLIFLPGFLAAYFTYSRNVSFLVLFIGLGVIGFIDDYVVPKVTAKRGLGWKQKLLLELIVAIYPAIQVGLGWEPFAVSLFLILFMANAYNFSDGLDGLAAFLGLILFCTIGLFGIFVGLPGVSLFCAIIAGCIIPFACYNAPKAKLFMGDVGSLPIGGVLGLVIADLVTFRASMWAPIAILCVVMIVELVPVPLQIFWVKVFKKKLFPFTPIHHAYEKAGWPELKVTKTFVLTQFFLSVLSLLIYFTFINNKL